MYQIGIGGLGTRYTIEGVGCMSTNWRVAEMIPVIHDKTSRKVRKIFLLNNITSETANTWHWK